MPTNRYTKVLLTVGVLLLAVIALRPIINPDLAAQAQVSKSSRQQWEYKVIVRSFKWDDKATISGTSSMSEDNKALSGTDMLAKLAELGAQGWELVGVTPYSEYTQTRTASPSGNTDGPFIGWSMNGLTTTDKWIFKRAK